FHFTGSDQAPELFGRHDLGIGGDVTLPGVLLEEHLGIGHAGAGGKRGDEQYRDRRSKNLADSSPAEHRSSSGPHRGYLLVAGRARTPDRRLSRSLAEIKRSPVMPR